MVLSQTHLLYSLPYFVALLGGILINSGVSDVSSGCEWC